MRVLVGFLPGSSNDMIARFVGGRLAERLGTQAVIDNRPGAGGIIANEIAANASPDGNTLLLTSVSHTMGAAVYKLPYDPIKSFSPIAMVGVGPLVLVAQTPLPATNVKELIDLARAKPGTITFASAGTGGVNHFAGEMFSRMTGIKMIHVPYKGGAPALTDVIGGQVQIMFATLPLALRQVRAGKVKAFAVTGARRSGLLPEVPTVAEAGVPGYELNNWWGVLAPAGVPGPNAERLNAEIGTILAQPEAAQRLEAEGAEPRALSRAEFAKVIASDIEKWRRVAKEANIRAD
ncbi:MAG: tripartite tricarboxylate transporter substrate binding protein [Proteobacteria bacterium]|nr:tripartite tricarboxylate transporter substrate binding protein [Burkholderiales bacterium]